VYSNSQFLSKLSFQTDGKSINKLQLFTLNLSHLDKLLLLSLTFLVFHQLFIISASEEVPNDKFNHEVLSFFVVFSVVFISLFHGENILKIIVNIITNHINGTA